MDYGAHDRHDQAVPNLSRHRRHPALIAAGSAIRSARKGAGVSQEMLALVAGIDRSHVGRIERGDNNIALLTLLALADVLNRKPSELLREAGL